MNALSYVPYKKCSSIIKFLAKLGMKIWKSRDIPVDWAMAYIILLPKSENLTLVSDIHNSQRVADEACIAKTAVHPNELSLFHALMYYCFVYFIRIHCKNAITKTQYLYFSKVY